jgi:hypothetical protein
MILEMFSGHEFSVRLFGVIKLDKWDMRDLTLSTKGVNDER